MLSFSSILSDSKNFIINNLIVIMAIVISLAIFMQIIFALFEPNIDMIAPIQQLFQQSGNGNNALQIFSQKIDALPETERMQILSSAISYLLQFLCVSFITNIISTSIILSAIYNLSYNQLTLKSLLQHSVRMLAKILVFMLLMIPYFLVLSIFATLIPFLGSLILLAGLLFYLIIYMLYLSVIIEPVVYLPSFIGPVVAGTNFTHRIKTSWLLFKHHCGLVLAMFALWVVAIFLFSSLAELIMAMNIVNNAVADIIVNIIGQLLSFLMICYFYRLYTLTAKKIPDDSGY